MLIYAFYKSKDRKKHFILLSTYAGFAYIFEYIVVVLLDAYVYKPTFFKHRVLDNLFGAILSQLFYVPVTALFLTVFQLNWKVKLLFSLLYSLIEKLFVTLRIFNHRWWKTKFTFVLIWVSFLANNQWYRKIKQGNGTILFFSLYNMILVTWMNMIALMTFLKQVKYGSGTWKEHIKIPPLFILPGSLLLAKWAKEGSFLSKLKSLLFMMSIDLFSLKKRIVNVKSLYVLPIIYLTTILTASFYKKLIYDDKLCDGMPKGGWTGGNSS